MVNSFRFETDKVELPSLGRAYLNEGVELIDGRCVRVRKFLTKDDRAYKGAVKSRNTYKIYTKLLENLVVSPRIKDFDPFLITDVLAILYMIKIWSFGQMAEFRYLCLNCRMSQILMVDLGKLNVRYADEVENFMTDNIKIKLPESGDVVEIHIPRLRDEKAIQTHLMHEQNAGRMIDEEEDERLVRLAQHIDKINGVEKWSLIDKFVWLTEQELADVDEIAYALNENETGILLVQDVTCKKCENKVLIDLEIGPEFFRPVRRRGRGDDGEPGTPGDVSEHKPVRDSGNDTTLPDGSAPNGGEDRQEGRSGTTEESSEPIVAERPKSRSEQVKAIIEKAQLS